jgi:hypothetical protein
MLVSLLPARRAPTSASSPARPGSACLDVGSDIAAGRQHLTLAGNEPACRADIRVRHA